MRDLSHVLAYVYSTPWAMLPSRAHAMLAVLRRRAAGVRLSDWEAEAVVGESRRSYDARRALAQGGRSRGGVAVLPVYGILTHRQHDVDDASGGGLTASETVARAIRAVDADPEVGAILLDVDSPGGSVFGVEEMAAAAAATTKPLVAVANSLAASAAYWLASQADELVVTPSGEVGSIGVLTLHEDVSAAMEMEGIRGTFVYAGEHKVEGNPLEPLGDEARAAMQARVDDYYRAFVGGVGKGRGVSAKRVESDFGQGRTFGAKEAVSRGMADRVGTFEETLARLTAGKYPKKRGARAEGAIGWLEAERVFTDFGDAVALGITPSEGEAVIPPGGSTPPPAAEPEPAPAAPPPRPRKAIHRRKLLDI